MDPLKSSTTQQQQSPSSSAKVGADAASSAAAAAGQSAAAPGRQRGVVRASLDAVPATAPVGDTVVRQRIAAENAARLRELAKQFDRKLSFRVTADDETVIEVVDRETGEVVSTIPSEEQQRVIETLEQGDSSALLDGAA